MPRFVIVLLACASAVLAQSKYLRCLPEDGTPCTDRYFCTTNDQYNRSRCVDRPSGTDCCRGTPVDSFCCDANVCTRDKCDSGTGCTSVPETNLASIKCSEDVDDACVLESFCSTTNPGQCDYQLKPAGTPCASTDNLCTFSECTAQGSCQQTTKANFAPCSDSPESLTDCSRSFCLNGECYAPSVGQAFASNIFGFGRKYQQFCDSTEGAVVACNLDGQCSRQTQRRDRSGNIVGQPGTPCPGEREDRDCLEVRVDSNGNCDTSSVVAEPLGSPCCSTPSGGTYFTQCNGGGICNLVPAATATYNGNYNCVTGW